MFTVLFLNTLKMSPTWKFSACVGNSACGLLMTPAMRSCGSATASCQVGGIFLT